jgi:hypothetical protein
VPYTSDRVSSDGISGEVSSTGTSDQGAVGQRYAQCFGLHTADVASVPEPTVAARGLQALAAELASAVGPRERRDHQVAPSDGGDIASDVLDHTDAFVAH